ncbi:23S rRNA (uracil(1939)-C(5))-methyltransferase RlmD [Vagococcus vulneris]|uniref:23S rRNA (Uracil(1939)-C(5))-methyltransferase RlmD n=1 Tax=Vagococcus vulneris TaxID=1977869 RepID=A0A430A256_9ENTE|nr:23S rRNA (uracil(1939)-C(5))-methyltransferase RlmD [Vagococcus vulneris]RSU00505.1 23S rRNA (uracil(1939)-C(5))-methyltransferase RlmD [Vagococcus vulneris]
MKNNNVKNLVIKKNDVAVVEISDLTHDGMGVGKIDGYPLFIENALPGEVVQIQVVKTTKKFGFGKVLEIREASQNRVEDVQNHLIRTGIAPLHHMTYEAQLTFKENQVENCLKRIGKLTDVQVLPTIGMDHPFAYRNKAQIPVRKIDNQLEFGFFRKNSHHLVPVSDFFIQEQEIDDALVVLKSILKKYQVKAYDEENDTGNLKNIMIRQGHYSKEMMIVFITKKKKVFKIDDICQQIIKELPKVKSIMQNIQPDQLNNIFGDDTFCLYGQDYITDTLLGNTYKISAKSFYQINTIQTEKLYSKAFELADLKPSDVVIDAYCGIGTIGLSIAKKVKQVYGVEVVKDAITDAKLNAELNHIKNAEFIIGKAEHVFEKWNEDGIHADVLFVDPPRKGLDPSFIDASVAMKPEKIVYVSCNPSTLARDLAIYEENGYHAKIVQPIDMFPQTAHIESVVLLNR